MEQPILMKYDKITLRNMAVDKGLTPTGFNGRHLSRMRKQDFIDFILFKYRESRHELEDDDVFNIFQDLILDDSVQPLIHIINAFYDSETVHILNRTLSVNDDKKNSLDRIPNEEDETVPNFYFHEVSADKNCSLNCKCETCEKNQKIINENQKVKLNIQNIETKITCVVCQCNMRNIIFSPCNHLATCISCSKNPLLGDKCPLCRKLFNNTIRIFFC